MTLFSKVMSAIYTSTLLSLHAYTGCDTVSAFKGKGKLKPLKALQLYPRFIETLAKLGKSWSMDKDLLDEIEAFTCAMYGRPKFLHVDDLRFYMLSDKCKNETIGSNTNIALSELTPYRKSHVQHAKRANFQRVIWKREHVPTPDIPKANDRHGWHECDGKL